MATRPLLIDNEFNSVYNLEGPEQLGLGSGNSDLDKLTEAKKRSSKYQGFRDIVKPFISPNSYIRGGANLASGIMEGLGTASDFLGLPEGSVAYGDLAEGFKKYSDEFGRNNLFDSKSNKNGNVVSRKDQPRRGAYSPVAIEDRSVDEDVFNEEGPLGSMDQDLIKKINSRNNFDAKRDLIDEESNLKTFPPTIGQIGEAQTDANSMEDIGGPPTDPTEDLFTSAMQEFITGARGAGPDSPKEKTIEDYKKEFAKATGIDVSGKVDKSSALMAMGLALMQNKAGKGFNVGRILGEVGKAGEKALPKLEAAKAVARQGALAGGKYALNKQSSDETLRRSAQEKTLDRGKYWVYKKGKTGQEFANFDDGSFVDLNKYEINDLITNSDFEKQFEFIKGSDRLDILKTRAEAANVDYGNEYDSGGLDYFSLTGSELKDTSPLLTILAVARDPNYKGDVTGKPQFKTSTTDKQLIANITNAQNDVNKNVDRFKSLIDNINEGVTIPGQIISKAKELAIAFGLRGKDAEPSTIQDAQRVLGNIAIDEATAILQESGKTLSDTDRQLVKQRVSTIDFKNANPVAIKRQLNDIYDMIVGQSQRNIDTAILTLEEQFGIQFESTTSSNPPTQAELDQLNVSRKAKGKKLLTMDDF
tara:strand:- start:3181 stop:5118 length:1938 start_codon:yes stop_codon:yes gene_type:complete